MVRSPARVKTLAVVNRFYPPDPAITGNAAHELTAALRERLPDVRVKAYCTAAPYEGGEVRDVAGGDLVRLTSRLGCGNRVARLLFSLLDGWRLARRASRDADAVISLTDPALLGLWVGRACARRRIPWMEWTMDLYPEAFVSAGLMSRAGVVFRRLLEALRRHPPDAILALGPGQAEFYKRERAFSGARLIFPCGIREFGPVPHPSWKTLAGSRVVVVYAGNLGEAHSPDALALFVERADPFRFFFVLSAYGSRAGAFRGRIGNRGNVAWCDPVLPEELVHGDVHIVSLKAGWTHVCVPSKAVTAVSAGRPIVFFGSANSDTWRLLGKAGWLVAEQQGGGYLAADVDQAITAIVSGELATKTAEAGAIARSLWDMRSLAFDDVARWARAAVGSTD